MYFHIYFTHLFLGGNNDNDNNSVYVFSVTYQLDNRQQGQ